MIDDDKDDEERDTDPKTPANELFLDRQERLGFDFSELITKIGFRHSRRRFPGNANDRGGLFRRL
jgi:hypothetical protein